MALSHLDRDNQIAPIKWSSEQENDLHLNGWLEGRFMGLTSTSSERVKRPLADSWKRNHHGDTEITKNCLLCISNPPGPNYRNGARHVLIRSCTLCPFVISVLFVVKKFFGYRALYISFIAFWSFRMPRLSRSSFAPFGILESLNLGSLELFAGFFPTIPSWAILRSQER